MFSKSVSRIFLQSKILVRAPTAGLSTSAKQNEILIASRDEFNTKVLKSDKPVVLDFYADWCGPCKRLMPLLQDKAKTSDGKWVLAKVNIDDHEDLAVEFNVQAVPTVYLFHKGEVKHKFMGLPSNDKLNEFIKNAEDLAKK